MANHFATLQDVEVVAEDATATVSVIDGDGVHLRNIDLSGAETGVLLQFAKSLLLGESTISASETGVALGPTTRSSLVENTAIRNAETAVFLNGRLEDNLSNVDATVRGNTFEGVERQFEIEGTATITDGDGETIVGSEPPDDSILGLILYAATAGTVGLLFYPYGRRRLRSRR